MSGYMKCDVFFQEVLIQRNGRRQREPTPAYNSRKTTLLESLDKSFCKSKNVMRSRNFRGRRETYLFNFTIVLRGDEIH